MAYKIKAYIKRPDEDFCDVPIGWEMHKKMVEP